MRKIDNVKDLLLFLTTSFTEAGYQPTQQIIGYIMTNDLAYITTHNNARNIVADFDKTGDARYEILHELLNTYFFKEK